MPPIPSGLARGQAKGIQQSSKHIEWNDKYQRILSAHVQDEEMALKRDILMIEVVGLFQDHASKQAREIIDNLHLSTSQGFIIYLIRYQSI